MTKPIHGVADTSCELEHPLRVQNLVVQFSCPIAEDAPSCFQKSYGNIALRVLFGRKRQRVTGFISCSEGLDLSAFVLALEVFKLVAVKHVGVFPHDDVLRVKTVELLQDYQRLRLDGINCLTLESFLGSHEKLYNKSQGIRSEIRVKPDSVEAIYALLKGGTISYDLVKLAFRIYETQDKLLEVIRHLAEGVNQLQRMIFDFLERREQRGD